MEKNKAVLKHCIKPAFFLSSFLRKEAKKNLEKLPDSDLSVVALWFSSLLQVFQVAVLEGSAPTFLTLGLLAT